MTTPKKANTAAKSYSIWLLWLVPPAPFGRLLCTLLLGSFTALLFWWGGVFGADSGSIPTAARAAAAYFCFLIAYLPATLHFIVERTESAFDRLLPSLPADLAHLPDTPARLRHSIRYKPMHWIALNLALGVVLWLIQSLFLSGGVNGMLQSVTSSSESLLMTLGPLPVWLFTSCTIGVMVNNARLFRRLARLVTCDVYNTEPLMEFGSMAVSGVLLIIGMQAAFSIMWLGGIDSPWAIAPGLLISLVAMVYLLFAPITPLHPRLKEAKSRSLEELQRQIAIVGTASFDSADPAQTRRLADLLVLRNEISRVREWPFAMDSLARLGLYLVIVPLTWVGAALIEMLVDALMQ